MSFIAPPVICAGFCVLFSRRRRHTRCALATGVLRVLFRSLRNATPHGRRVVGWSLVGLVALAIGASALAGMGAYRAREAVDTGTVALRTGQIGRAACRGRVCQYL